MTELIGKEEATKQIRDFLKSKIDEGVYTLDTVDMAELILKIEKLKGSEKNDKK